MYNLLIDLVIHKLSDMFDERVENLFTFRWNECLFLMVSIILIERGSLQQAKDALKNEDLLNVAFLVNAEEEFVAHFKAEENNLPTKIPGVLMTMLMNVMETTSPPDTHEEAKGLLKEHDVYDKYIRMREASIKSLRSRISQGLVSDHSVRKIINSFLAYIEENKLKVLTFKCSNTSDHQVNPNQEITNKIIEDWLVDYFGEEDGKKFAFEKFFDAPNHFYPFMLDIETQVEIQKSFVLAFIVDDAMEVCPDILDATLDAFNGRKLDAMDWQTSERMFYKRCIEDYVESCKKIDKMLPPNNFTFESNKTWIEGIKFYQDKKCFPNSVEEYLEWRFIEIGAVVHICYCLAMCGPKMGSISEHTREEFKMCSKYLLIENDLYSYGKETFHTSPDDMVNIIEVYKRCYPELTYQEAVYKVEELRDELYHCATVLKGTELNGYYVGSVGIVNFHKNANRYLKHMLLCKNTALIFHKNASQVARYA